MAEKTQIGPDAGAIGRAFMLDMRREVLRDAQRANSLCTHGGNESMPIQQ